MAQIQTIDVIDRESGEPMVINESDFDAARHARCGDVEQGEQAQGEQANRRKAPKKRGRGRAARVPFSG